MTNFNLKLNKKIFPPRIRSVKHFIFSLILAITTLSAQQCFEQGDEPLDTCNSCPAYSFPAGVKLSTSPSFFASASYLYWYAGQGGMDLATTGVLVGGFVVPDSTEGATLFQDFRYNSGFKLGLGLNCGADDWVFRADYTWLRSNTNTSNIAPASNLGTGVLYFTDWYYQVNATGDQGIAATQFSSQWQLGIDWLDLTASRSFYQGHKWVMAPYAGVRVSWIRQTIEIAASGLANATPPITPLLSHNNSSSWALGPRAGADLRLLLGSGVRLQGNFGASLLFTQFTRVSHLEGTITTGGTPVSYAFYNNNCLRPMLESNLGLGWGTYSAERGYHFDVSVTYDFNYLWGQNMIRVLNDLNIIGVNGAANDLFLHGLTLMTKLDF